MSHIPYGRQDINQEDIDAVLETLKSDWLTQGPAIERFEKSIAELSGAKYAVAVCNATAALHIACLAAGLEAGGRLWTSPNTFVASANCGLYCGAYVDFVDIDPQTYNLSPTKLAEKLALAKKTGTLPQVLIPVHFAGQSCRMKEIREIVAGLGITIIEDASHAVGGSYRNCPIGSGEFSDMTVLSFHPVKIITTGEGGMVLTNRSDLYEKLIRLRSHGITRDPRLMTHAPDGPWYMQQIDLGFNYRITDLQAALGVSQARRLRPFVARRRELAARYASSLKDLPIILPYQDPEGRSAFHLFPIRIDSEKSPKDRARVFADLRAADIGVNVHYIPVHTQPYYQVRGFRPGDFPVAEKYYSEAISLPMFSGLSDLDQDRVIQELRRSLGA